MLRDLVIRNRSYRRFDQSFKISREIMIDLVALARLTPSGMNLQPLKYYISYSEEINEKIFPALTWAAYLQEWHGPDNGERPSGYIIVLGDKLLKENFGIDPGIAAQTILLGAVEMGLGGCILGGLKKDIIRDRLMIPENFEILLVIALGKPAERVVVENFPETGDHRYYRDAEGIHHVPKRNMEDLVIN